MMLQARFCLRLSWRLMRGEQGRSAWPPRCNWPRRAAQSSATYSHLCSNMLAGAQQLPTLASAGVIQVRRQLGRWGSYSLLFPTRLLTHRAHVLQLSAHLADEVHAQHPYSTRAPGGPPRMVAWDTKIGGGSAGPRSLRFEQGKLAKLADGSCVVRYGKTTVLCTAVADHTPPAEAQDFMPFQVDYQERLSAAGRLPTTPDRRERSTSDREVLAARLIDRALRPLFPPGFLYNVHVHATVLSADGVCDPDIIALNAASAALMVSGAALSASVLAATPACHG